MRGGGPTNLGPPKLGHGDPSTRAEVFHNRSSGSSIVRKNSSIECIERKDCSVAQKTEVGFIVGRGPRRRTGMRGSGGYRLSSHGIGAQHKARGCCLLECEGGGL